MDRDRGPRIDDNSITRQESRTRATKTELLAPSHAGLMRMRPRHQLPRGKVQKSTSHKDPNNRDPDRV